MEPPHEVSDQPLAAEVEEDAVSVEYPPTSLGDEDIADDGSFAVHVMTGENLKTATRELEQGNGVVASILVEALEQGLGDEEELSLRLASVLGNPIQACQPKREKLKEYCCSDSSACCRVAAAHDIPYIGLSLKFGDLSAVEVQEQVHYWFKERTQVGETIHLWGSISCGPWSPLQNLNIAVQGQAFESRLEVKRLGAFGILPNLGSRGYEVGGVRDLRMA